MRVTSKPYTGAIHPYCGSELHIHKIHKINSHSTNRIKDRSCLDTTKNGNQYFCWKDNCRTKNNHMQWTTLQQIYPGVIHLKLYYYTLKSIGMSDLIILTYYTLQAL